MKRTLLAALCITLMLFVSGCRNNTTGNNMANDAENMVNDAENMAEDIVKSVFPSELQDKDSEYFKVTEHSIKDNSVTLKGAVMRRSTNDNGGIEYEYGKQDSELTFDANHAEISSKEEGKADSAKMKFSEYLTKHGDSIKDKVFKVTIRDGVVTTLEEADYNDNK